MEKQLTEVLKLLKETKKQRDSEMVRAEEAEKELHNAKGHIQEKLDQGIMKIKISDLIISCLSCG